MDLSQLEKLKPIDLPQLGERPLVSVLIANYNYARYLPEALESALSQTYSNLEVIICDDGSTDESCRTAEHYRARDERVKLIRKDNGGVSSALNAAYAAAKGDLIALLDADDVWFPKRLECVIGAFRADRSAGMIIHLMRVIDSYGQVLSTNKTREPLSEGWLGVSILSGRQVYLPPASALTFRRELMQRMMPLPVAFRTLADALLRERAALLAPVAAVREVLASYRLHGRNVTGVPALATIQEIDQASGAIRRIAQARAEFAKAVHGVDLEEPEHERRIHQSLRVARSFLNGEHLSSKEVALQVSGLRRRAFWIAVFTVPRALGRTLYGWWRTRSGAITKTRPAHDCIGKPATPSSDVFSQKVSC